MINIGDTIYGYSTDHNRTGSNGLPKYWEAYEVVGETKVSWLVGHAWNPIKVDKKTLEQRGSQWPQRKFAANRECMEQQIWISDNRHKICNVLNHCTDYDKLKRIEAILNE